MKKLIRLIAIIVVVSFTAQSHAQTFGFQAGFNLAKVHAKGDNSDFNDYMKTNPGFNVGFTGDFSLNKLLSIETGLILDKKGSKLDIADIKMTLNAYFLDIPVALKAGIDIGGLRIYAKAGPYVGIGLFGNLKTNYFGETETDKIKWGSGSEEVNRLDFGGVIGAGFEFSNLQIGVTYQLGITNMSNDDISSGENYKEKNRLLSISLGYRFGGAQK